MNFGKWIILTKKLPTSPSPPKMSIFYAVPWELDIEKLKRQWMKYKCGGDYRCSNAKSVPSVNEMIKDLKNVDLVSDGIGSEPTDTTAMKIFYKGEQIKVWGYEYNGMKHENWPDYYPEAYTLIPDTETQKYFMNVSLKKSQRPIYDAALVDGCNEFQALLVACGKDIDDSPPPIGWFKIREEYGRIYCDEWELKET